MKVYCKDCKHYVDWGETGDEWCLDGVRYRATYRRLYPEYDNPANKNKDNNCPGWSPNLRYRLARWLKKWN